MALGIDEKEKKPVGVAAAPGPAQQQPTSIPQPQRKATGFTNLNKYLQANVGNKLGQTVGGGVQGTAQKAQQGLQQQQQQFGQQAQGARVGTDQDVQKMQNVLQDPTKASEEDVAAFQKFRTQGYTGPQGLQDAQAIQSQAQQAAQMGQAIGSSGGRAGLLQRFVGGAGQYTGGQQNLDQMLLGRSAGSQLREARKAGLGAAKSVQEGVQGAQSQAQQFGNEAEAFKRQVTGAVGEKTAAGSAELSDAMKAAEERKAALGQELKAGLQSGELTQEQANMLGLKEGQEMYGVDLSKYLDPSAVAATQQNVATPEQMARMNALSRLGGTQAFGSAEDAGSFGKDQFGFKKNYEQDVNIAKGQYDREMGQGLMASQMGGEGAETRSLKDWHQLGINREKYAPLEAKFNELAGQPSEVDKIRDSLVPDGEGGYSAEDQAKLQQAQQLDAQRAEEMNNIQAQQRAINTLGDTGIASGGRSWQADAMYDELQNRFNPNKKLKFKGIQGLMNPNVREGLQGPS